jgi:hypothetical protein
MVGTMGRPKKITPAIAARIVEATRGGDKRGGRGRMVRVSVPLAQITVRSPTLAIHERSSARRLLWSACCPVAAALAMVSPVPLRRTDMDTAVEKVAHVLRRTAAWPPEDRNGWMHVQAIKTLAGLHKRSVRRALARLGEQGYVVTIDDAWWRWTAPGSRARPSVLDVEHTHHDQPPE